MNNATEGTVSISAVGDIAFWKRMQDRCFRREGSPFQHVALLLSETDLRVGNFELPISADGVPSSWETWHGALVPPESASMLECAQFDVLGIANNHIMDWGIEGLQTTQSTLAQQGICTVGAGMHLSEARRPVCIETNGIRIGFLAYCKASDRTALPGRPGAAPIVVDQVCNDIDLLRPQVHHVVLLLHWGVEYCDYPIPDDALAGHRFIDAGATIVFGSHAHVPQGYELYKHGVVFYGLGNFVYDTMAERVTTSTRLAERRSSMIARVGLNAQGILYHKIVPCMIDDCGYPHALEGEAALQELDRLRQLSERIGDPDAAYGTAIDNLLDYQLKMYRYYLKRDGLRVVFRAAKWFKPRHVKMLAGWLRARARRATARWKTASTPG